jgi:hypothetical protein
MSQALQSPPPPPQQPTPTAQPIGNNVMPFPPRPGGPPPGMMPNPAFAQWQQQAAQVREIMQANQQKQQQFDDAVALIKKDGIHGFKLDIEADSTIAPDEEAEKRSRVEFLQQMIPMLEQVMPIAQGNPPLAALAREMTLFAVRGFRVARSLEEAFETAFDAIAHMPPNPKVAGEQKGGTQQNPQIEAAKVAADVHDTQTKAQVDQAAIAQKAQAAADQVQIERDRMASEAQKTQGDLALRTADIQQRGMLEAARVGSLDSRGARGLV